MCCAPEEWLLFPWDNQGILLRGIAFVPRNTSGHKQTDVIVMDFAKAFDKVPHKRLLYKLDFYGIRGSTHKWIDSWLSEPSQKVVLDGRASDAVPVLSGVP